MAANPSERERLKWSREYLKGPRLLYAGPLVKDDEIAIKKARRPEVLASIIVARARSIAPAVLRREIPLPRKTAEKSRLLDAPKDGLL